MNQEVFNEAMKLSTIGDKDNLWMGITNLRDNNVFEYESDGQAVVSGMWEPAQPNARNIHHCVTVYEGQQEWFFETAFQGLLLQLDKFHEIDS